MIERQYFDRVFGPVDCEIASRHTYIQLLEYREEVKPGLYEIDLEQIIKLPSVSREDVFRLIYLGFVEQANTGLFRFPDYDEVGERLGKMVINHVLQRAKERLSMLRDEQRKLSPPFVEVK